MKKKLYEYIVEIAKDPKYTVIEVREQELLLENDEQWVYKFFNKFFIQEKKNALIARFVNDSFIYKIPFYRVYYYTTEKGEKAEKKVKKALDKLVKEVCFITDIVENTKLEFKERVC